MNNDELIVSDDLNLKTFSFEKDTISSNDDVIRNLKDENGRLMKLLHEKDFEIKKLKRDSLKCSIIKDVSNVDKSISSEGMASMKIIELSKKIREATAELESWKCKYFQQAKENKHLQNEIIQAKSRQNGQESVPSQPTNETFDELRSAKEKLRSAESRVLELLTSNQKLSKDMKIATKVLEDELGDPNIDLTKLLNNGSNWRGRSQKILALNDKVDKLQRQLKAVAECGCCHGDGNGAGRDISSGATSIGAGSLDRISVLGGGGGSGCSSKSSERQSEVLARLQRDRHQNQLKLEQDHQRLADEHAKLRQACDSLKCRNQALTVDAKAHKQQIKNMLDKAKNDDELIASLLHRQAQLQTAIQSLMDGNGGACGSGGRAGDGEERFGGHKGKEEHPIQRAGDGIDDTHRRQLHETMQPDLRDGHSGGTGATDVEQLRATDDSFQLEIERLRAMAVAHDERLQRLVERNTALGEENSHLKQYCLQLERDIQRISPQSKFKSKLNPSTGETFAHISDARLAGLLSADAAPTKEVLADLQAAILLKLDKIDSLNVALDLMTLAKQQDVAILTDIIDQTRHKFVATVNKLKILTNENQL